MLIFVRAEYDLFDLILLATLAPTLTRFMGGIYVHSVTPMAIILWVLQASAHSANTACNPARLFAHGSASPLKGSSVTPSAISHKLMNWRNESLPGSEYDHLVFSKDSVEKNKSLTTKITPMFSEQCELETGSELLFSPPTSPFSTFPLFFVMFLIHFVDSVVCVRSAFSSSAGYVVPTLSSASGCVLGWFLIRAPYFSHLGRIPVTHESHRWPAGGSKLLEGIVLDY